MSPRHNIGDAPIQPEFHELMNNVARGLDEIFNGDAKGAKRETGFILLVFKMNGGGERESRCNYISNADRADIIDMLKEQIARFEGGAPLPPKQKAGHA